MWKLLTLARSVYLSEIKYIHIVLVWLQNFLFIENWIMLSFSSFILSPWKP